MVAPDEGDGLRLVDAFEDLTDLELLDLVRHAGQDARRAEKVLMTRHLDLITDVGGWCRDWMPKDRTDELERVLPDRIESWVRKLLRRQDPPTADFRAWFEPDFRRQAVGWILDHLTPFIRDVVRSSAWGLGCEALEDIESETYADVLRRLNAELRQAMGYEEEMSQDGPDDIEGQILVMLHPCAPEGIGNVKSWLRRVITHNTSDYKRRKQRRADELDAMDERETERLLQAREAGAVNETDTLLAALVCSADLMRPVWEKLTRRERRALWGKSRGLTDRAIAEDLSREFPEEAPINENNAKQIVHRARKKLMSDPKIVEHITGAVREKTPKKKGKSDDDQGK